MQRDWKHLDIFKPIWNKAEESTEEITSVYRILISKECMIGSQTEKDVRNLGRRADAVLLFVIVKGWEEGSGPAWAGFLKKTSRFHNVYDKVNPQLEIPTDKMFQEKR